MISIRRCETPSSFKYDETSDITVFCFFIADLSERRHHALKRCFCVAPCFFDCLAFAVVFRFCLALLSSFRTLASSPLGRRSLIARLAPGPTACCSCSLLPRRLTDSSSFHARLLPPLSSFAFFFTLVCSCRPRPLACCVGADRLRLFADVDHRGSHRISSREPRSHAFPQSGLSVCHFRLSDAMFAHAANSDIAARRAIPCRPSVAPARAPSSCISAAHG